MKYKTPAALEMAVKAAAKRSVMDTNRAISGFYFHRLLCRIFSVEDCGFVLKGGQSMLARTIDARYTKDIDLLSRGKDLLTAIEDLKRLALIDLGDYVRFEFEKAEPIKLEDEYRSGYNVVFSAWIGAKMVQAVSIDLVVDIVESITTESITPKDRIEVEDLRTFDYMIYATEDALADKLFGIVEQHDGRPSSRVKDLVGVVVYATTCPIDGKRLATNLNRESALRNIELPKAFAVPPLWQENYRPMFKKLCGQTGISSEFKNMDAAEALAKRLFDPLLESRTSIGIWNPDSLNWEQ